jgi:serine protease DegQ
MLKEVTPAVVSIRVTEAVGQNLRAPLPGQFPESMRRYFDFGDREPDGRLLIPEQESRPRRQGAGSGVIVDAGQGFIITNQHVVADADSISVTLADGRNFEAVLVGHDQKTDIALLQIQASNLKALQFADSDKAEVGDFVVAIGNPFGLGQTVTSGIISALGRAGLDNGNYEDFIQTDAAINRGNSGGALVDMEGRLLGINTAIISANGGGSDGIGFAVPANMVAAVVHLLEQDGEVRRGMLGVQISDVSPEIVAALKLGTQRGALVAGVLADSAAEAAGIEVYDVIVRVNGKEVENGRDVRNRIGLIRRGEAVQLGIVRGGEALNLTATIAGDEGVVAAASREPGIDRFAGATLRDAMGTASQPQMDGVAVVGVDPDSRSWQAGLREGDIIIELNREAIADLQQFRQELAAAGRLVALTVWREHRRLLVLVS